MDFFAGLLGGLSSSMPIGPINLMLLDMASRRSVAAPAFVLGVCLADGLLASLTLWGSLYILLEPNVALILGLICASLMFIYGVMSWQAKPAANTPQAPTVMVSTAMLGFGICILNPLFAVFLALLHRQLQGSICRFVDRHFRLCQRLSDWRSHLVFGDRVYCYSLYKPKKPACS